MAKNETDENTDGDEMKQQKKKTYLKSTRINHISVMFIKSNDLFFFSHAALTLLISIIVNANVIDRIKPRTVEWHNRRIGKKTIA